MIAMASEITTLWQDRNVHIIIIIIIISSSSSSSSSISSSDSLGFITCQYLWISVTPKFQT